MAKDDYFVIVGKILSFLYARLKGKTDRDISYLQPNTPDFPINQEYFDTIVINMYEEGLITGVNTVRAWGGDVINIGFKEDLRITHKGIEYIVNNRKIFNSLKNAPYVGWLVELLDTEK